MTERYVRMGSCIKCGVCCKFCSGFKPCKYLDEAHDNNCRIYTTKPYACSVYPHDWQHVIEGCGFYYIDTEDNDKVMPKIQIKIVDGIDVINPSIPKQNIRQKSETHRRDFQMKVGSEPMTIKAILWAKSWIAAIDTALSEGGKIKDVIWSTAQTLEHSDMEYLTYALAVKYMFSYSKYGKSIGKWYFHEGYNLLIGGLD